MANTNTTIALNIESLTALGARLSKHADAIVEDVAADLRLAADVARKLVRLRSRVDEIAEEAIERDPGVAHALRQTLTDDGSANPAANENNPPC